MKSKTGKSNNYPIGMEADWVILLKYGLWASRLVSGLKILIVKIDFYLNQFYVRKYNHNEKME